MKKLNSLFAIMFIMICGKPAFSQTVYISENFNAGLPGSWSISTPTCFNITGDTTVWTRTILGWRGQGLETFSLDSTEFAIIDSDQPGLFCQCNEFLTSPVFNATSSTTLFMEFDQFFRYYTGGFGEIGEVQVFNGTSWIVVTSFTFTNGSWMAPNQQSINITAYINANMQIRFRYNANWDWFWALDNIRVAENLFTGNQEITSETIFNIFPNPSSGKFTIQPDDKFSVAKISVRNTIGQEVFQSNVYQLSNSIIDLSDNSNGVYFIEIKTEDRIVTQKIVKQ